MRDETCLFQTDNGRIITVEGKKIVMNAGAQDSVRKGMRFQILREEAVRHPVTKNLGSGISGRQARNKKGEH
jgi:hypothetical protein